MPRRIAYLGPRGTFTEAATRIHVQRLQVAEPVLVAHRGIPEVMLDVAGGGVDLGVVPVENSIEGPVTLTLDYLAHEVDLAILAEVIIQIRHSLLVLPGADPTEISAVFSHPHALAQCRENLGQMLPQAELRPCGSTAEAARLVRHEAEPAWAAVGTELAAELYDLEVLARDLQDVKGNATRFLVVGKGSPVPTGCDKTSIVFAFAYDRPGNLYRALREFARREINLTKLESRPARKSLGDYLFFADLEGHREERIVAEALQGLRQQCSLLRVLGSYARDCYSPEQV